MRTRFETEVDVPDVENSKKCASELQEWLIDHQIAVLNVAGNRESCAPGL